jgi:hypothetical protein
MSSVLLLVLLFGCNKPAPPAKTPQFLVTSTLREVMESMVMPSADELWKAVSTTVTDKGTVEKAPHSEEDWKNIRARAVTLMEASDLILIPGRHAAPPGSTAQDPKVQLKPEQIDKLIADDPESWAHFAHRLHDSVIPALKAIDAKDTMGLSDAGDAIDKACESCHLKYWYPNEGTKN